MAVQAGTCPDRPSNVGRTSIDTGGAQAEECDRRRPGEHRGDLCGNGVGGVVRSGRAAVR